MALALKIAPYGRRGPDASRPRQNPGNRFEIVIPGCEGVKVAYAVTVRKPADQLYAFWRNPENLPQLLGPPVSITRTSDLESHWAVGASPGDGRLEWDVFIITDEPRRLIAWRSREGAEIASAGSVRFELAPGDEGTEVTVRLEYLPAGKKPGAWLATLSREEAGRQVSYALRNFKALMEAGEIPVRQTPEVPGFLDTGSRCGAG